MTVRDVRQKWPEAERRLAEEGEIVITRDGKPVARLLPVEVDPPRKRFDPEEQRRWLKEMWGDETFDTLTPLMEDREDRDLISESALAAMAALDEEEEQSANDTKADSKPRRNL
ncbi:MAG: hypothetical protein WEB53_10385 [Akkermansiaceae bacterium]